MTDIKANLGTPKEPRIVSLSPDAFNALSLAVLFGWFEGMEYLHADLHTLSQLYPQEWQATVGLLKEGRPKALRAYVYDVLRTCRLSDRPAEWLSQHIPFFVLDFPFQVLKFFGYMISLHDR